MIAFGSFRLLPARQLLLEGDQQITLGSRALDILVTLAERAGDVVSKEDLIARVWPNTFVEDSNLRVHISGLRRALRDGQSGTRYVVTVPGRGYSFVAPVSVSQEKAAAASLDLSLAPTSDLPAPPTQFVGRTDVISALAAQLGHRRLVTLVGPGGIGKTTVALAVARAVSRTYSDGVGYVDLSSISDPRLLGGAIATTLGLAINADNMIPTLIAFLRQKETLLVLDSCEHVIEAAAITAEELSQHLPSLHILATSREPLCTARGC